MDVVAPYQVRGLVRNGLAPCYVTEYKTPASSAARVDLAVTNKTREHYNGIAKMRSLSKYQLYVL